jgi:hypothetical protein
MVHCGVTPPYPSLSHPTKGVDSRKYHGDCNVLGGYTKRGRGVNKIGVGAVAIGQYNDEVVRHGKDKSHV